MMAACRCDIQRILAAAAAAAALAVFGSVGSVGTRMDGRTYVILRLVAQLYP